MPTWWAKKVVGTPECTWKRAPRSSLAPSVANWMIRLFRSTLVAKCTSTNVQWKSLPPSPVLVHPHLLPSDRFTFIASVSILLPSKVEEPTFPVFLSNNDRWTCRETGHAWWNFFGGARRGGGRIKYNRMDGRMVFFSSSNFFSLIPILRSSFTYLRCFVYTCRRKRAEESFFEMPSVRSVFFHARRRDIYYFARIIIRARHVSNC